MNRYGESLVHANFFGRVEVGGPIRAESGRLIHYEKPEAREFDPEDQPGYRLRVVVRVLQKAGLLHEVGS